MEWGTLITGCCRIHHILTKPEFKGRDYQGCCDYNVMPASETLVKVEYNCGSNLDLSSPQLQQWHNLILDHVPGAIPLPSCTEVSYGATQGVFVHLSVLRDAKALQSCTLPRTQMIFFTPIENVPVWMPRGSVHAYLAEWLHTTRMIGCPE